MKINFVHFTPNGKIVTPVDSDEIRVYDVIQSTTTHSIWG